MTGSRPWYTVLYIQVIIAILIGVAVGYFFPGTGVALKPLGEVEFVNRQIREYFGDEATVRTA